MLNCLRYGNRGPVVVALHWLGGSARTWTEVGEAMARRGVQWVSVDLPGFGEAASTAGYSVAEMRDAVIATVAGVLADSGCGPADSGHAGWLLAGHSMGGKVSAAIAREAENGRPELAGLRGVFLVSPSPPQPEPMVQKTREQMLERLGESTGDEGKDRRYAKQFVDDNVGKQPLKPEIEERAIDGVLRMNRTAFRAWLEHGSYEDWRGRVARLQTPALIVAGSEEPSLGPDVQREMTLPHFDHGRVFALEGAGHLAPLSRPGQIVELLSEFAASCGLTLAAAKTALEPRFEALLASEAVSPQTRALLEARLASAGDSEKPGKLSDHACRVLRALAERVVPEAGFDLAARAEQWLGKPEGWRFDVLPPAVQAWEQGLTSLHAAAMRAHSVPFTALQPDQQDALLQQAAAGSLGKGILGTLRIGDSSDAFDGAQMKSWFEDVRSLLARLYMADPRTYQRIGYTGFADNEPFTLIQLGEPEDRYAVAGVAPLENNVNAAAGEVGA